MGEQQDLVRADSARNVIRTPDQRLRVFVSSTLQELAEERKAARQAIEQLRLSPVMFELGARPHAAKELYRAYLKQSHIFLGIYWQRYGWIAQDMTVSGLEDEYNLSNEMPKLIYIKRPATKCEPRLQQMLDRIANDNVSYKYFSSADELRESVQNDLIMTLSEHFEMSAPSQQASPQLQPAKRPNLPTPPTPIIGRENELTVLHNLLRQDEPALITLTGTGGAGKSRLALQVAHEVEDRFPDGVFFVELAAIRQPHLVTPAIAHALGIREEHEAKSISAVLFNNLHDKQILLVLDNFEHVLDAAPVVAGLLQNCPKLRILVTSRAPLKLRGEQEFPVEPLVLPDTSRSTGIDSINQSPAVQLFIERTRDVKPEFAVNEKNVQAVAEICTRLDGLPLAIELAAARSKLLSPQVMLDRLDSRLPLLIGGGRDLPERQRTLRNTIEWSYNLLDEPSKLLFHRSAAFAGSWSLEALEAICNPDGDFGTDLLDSLETLVDNCLIRQTNSIDGEIRFTMLETLHEFAWERLNGSGELDGLRQRHAQFYLDLVEATLPYQYRRFPDGWLTRLNAEFDNIRTAILWSSTPAADPELILRFTAASAWYWFMSGHLNEGYTWCKEALKRTEALGPTLQRGKAFLWAGGFGFTLGKYQEAKIYLEQSISTARRFEDQELLAASLTYEALVLTGLGDYRVSVERCSEGIDLAARIQFDWMKILAMRAMGDNYLVLEGIETALPWYKDSFQLAQQFGEPWLLSLSGRTIALLHTLAGDTDSALPLFNVSIGLMREAGDRWGLAYVLASYAYFLLREGEREEAGRMLVESLALARQVSSTTGIAISMIGFAGLAAANRDPHRAARLFGAADALLEALNVRCGPTEHVIHSEYLSATREQLEEAHFDVCYAEGFKMQLDEAVNYAQSS